MFEDILYDVGGGVARITFNRPDKLNALRIKTFEELAAALRLADEDENAGVVVIAGNGRAFCAGGDVEMTTTMLTSAGAGRYHFFGRMLTVSNLVLALSKPVICSVQGAAVGGGAELTLFADMVIADETAYFVMNGTAIGGCSWWGGPQLLPVIVGLRKAEEILYLSSRVTGEEAAQIGLVTKVVPAGQLEIATNEMCDRILDLSEEGMRYTKAALRSVKELVLSSMSASAEMNASALGKGDLHAAFEAFRDKRPMSWRALRPGLAAPTAS